MQFVINIDDEIISELDLANEMKELYKQIPDEEKQAILKDMIKEYLTHSDVIKGIFLQRGYNDYTYPTDEFKRLINKIDFTEEMEDVKQKMMGIITDDLKNVLVELFVNSFFKSLTESITKDSRFLDSMYYMIRSKYNN